jgi:hypothetical protein
VVLEGIGSADVAAHRLDALVPANIHHAEHVGSSLGRARQKARPQRVARLGRGIEAGQHGVALHDVSDALGLQGGIHDPVSLVHPPEDRAGRDLRRSHPIAKGLDHAELGAPEDGDLVPFAFLVGLAVADQDTQAVRCLCDVVDRQRHQLSLLALWINVRRGPWHPARRTCWGEVTFSGGRERVARAR